MPEICTAAFFGTLGMCSSTDGCSIATMALRGHTEPVVSLHFFEAMAAGAGAPAAGGKRYWCVVQAADHGHEPVLLERVLDVLAPRAGEVFVDCTAGRGGHAAALAAKLGPGGMLVGLDVDPKNLAYARQRVAETGGQARWFHANFAEVADALAEAGVERVDGLLADLGVSTNQLLEGTHGLSFNGDEPLDMRLDPRIKETAADLLRTRDEKQIADMIYQYADERFSFRIARKIVQTRTVEPIRTTGQLARIVRSAVPGSKKPGQIDPATRTFQAMRIAVNQEFESLEGLLEAIPNIMKPGGRVAIISFHSGEDRLVKVATRQWAADGTCELLTRKPVEPDEAEANRNPRSRSAKLRAVRFVAGREASAPHE